MSFVLVMSSFTTSCYHVFTSSIQFLNVFEWSYVGKSMWIDINSLPLLILFDFRLSRFCRSLHSCDSPHPPDSPLTPGSHNIPHSSDPNFCTMNAKGISLKTSIESMKIGEDQFILVEPIWLYSIHCKSVHCKVITK